MWHRTPAPSAAVATSTEQRRVWQRRRRCLPPVIRRTTERSSDPAVRFPTSRTFPVAAITVALAGVLGTACSKNETVDRDLSEAASRGEQVAVDAGCQACHGGNWAGGVGPSLVGLAGSTVSLDDGTTAVADDAYLTTAITEPAAQKTAGYTIVMPANQLTAEQVADVVAFIRELTPVTP